jgi:hypothetical protein
VVIPRGLQNSWQNSTIDVEWHTVLQCTLILQTQDILRTHASPVETNTVRVMNFTGIHLDEATIYDAIVQIVGY